MGKNDYRLPSVNKNMFDKGNWQAFTAVVKYIQGLTVWAETTKEKGVDGKKYNLLWLLPQNRKGEGGRGEIDFPLLDAEAHRNCHAKLYEQLYFNLNSLVPRTTHDARTCTLMPNKSVALSASACQVSLH